MQHQPQDACCPPAPPPQPLATLPAMQHDPLYACFQPPAQQKCSVRPCCACCEPPAQPCLQTCSVRPCYACCRPSSPSHTRDGRHGLFGTLQGTDAGPPSVDCWMGHPLINPTKGKLGLAAPTDLKGESHSAACWLRNHKQPTMLAFREPSCPFIQQALSWCMTKHATPYVTYRAACSWMLCGCK